MIVGRALALGILLAAVPLAGDARVHAAPRAAACGKIGPVAAQYVDAGKLCREARKEILHSLKTGKRPNWAKVVRGSVRPDGRHRGDHRVRRHRSRGRPPSHGASRTPEGSFRGTVRHGYSRQTRRPTESTSRSANMTGSRSLSGPAVERRGRDARNQGSSQAGRPREHVARGRPVPRGTARRDSPVGRAWLALLMSLLAGIAFTAGVKGRKVFAGRWPGDAFQPVTDTRRQRNRSNEPAFNAQPPRLTLPSQSRTRAWSPFDLSRIAMLGPGAEDAVRALILDTITGRIDDHAEVMISRGDSSRLLAVTAGDLVEEEVPGLVLFQDFPQAIACLRIPGPRRLLITYRGEQDLPAAVFARPPARTVIVSLAPWLYETVEIGQTGRVTLTTPHATPTDRMPVRLPLLPAADARARLCELPTRRRLSRYDDRGTPRTDLSPG